VTRVERRFETRFVELGDGVPVEVGPVQVTGFEVSHASGAPPFALRVGGEGRVVAYSGDTECTASLIDAARGADMLARLDGLAVEAAEDGGELLV
jgi:ribonuclease BN (tRNA processing enzyme)